MKNLHKLVLYIFVFIFIPIMAFFLITSRTSILFGLRSYVVLTGSMEPSIHTDSIIFSFPSKIYKKGDVITFKRGNVSVTHRIVGMKNNQFQTKGDANQSPDPILVSKELIYGKNIIAIPYIGKVTIFSKTIPGFTLLIVIPTFLFVFFEAKTIKKEFEKEIEKKLLSKLEHAE